MGLAEKGVARCSVWSDAKCHSVLMIIETAAFCSCVQRIIKVKPDGYLRLRVDGGGCSGFKYNFELADSLETDDHIFERYFVFLLAAVAEHLLTFPWHFSCLFSSGMGRKLRSMESPWTWFAEQN